MKSLIYEIIATASSIDAVGTRTLKPFDLTPMSFNILNLLKEGPMSQRELSERVIVAASSITFQVRQLQKKGLLQRRRADARTWRVSLTPLGLETRAKAEAEMDRVIAGLRFEGVAVEKAKAALAALRGQLGRESSRN